MAESVTIGGRSYLKRSPLGVLGLSVITLGIYGLYWYYKVGQEIRDFTGDETISPARSLLAVFPGGLIIVPPFIAVFNTATHVMRMEEQRGIASQVSPALTAILLLVGISIAIAPYVQEHLNRVWDAAAASGAVPMPGAAAPMPGGTAPMPPPPTG